MKTNKHFLKTLLSIFCNFMLFSLFFFFLKLNLLEIKGGDCILQDEKIIADKEGKKLVSIELKTEMSALFRNSKETMIQHQKAGGNLSQPSLIMHQTALASAVMRSWSQSGPPLAM